MHRFVVALGLGCICAPVLGAVPSFFVFIDDPGLINSGADLISAVRSVTADGSVAVGDARIDGPKRMFRWTAQTGVVPIEVPGGWEMDTDSVRISGDGSTIIANRFVNQSTQGARWTPSGGWELLADGTTGDVLTEAIDVSDDGTAVAGIVRDGAVIHGAVWKADAGIERVGDLPGGLEYSRASAIAGNGQEVFGLSNGATGNSAFRWTHGDGISQIFPLPTGIVASADGDGTTVVGSTTVGLTHQACRWTPGGGLQGLGVGTDVAMDVTSDGRIIVGGAYTLGAFLWTEPDGARSIQEFLSAAGVDFGSLELEVATGISDDGLTIAGLAQNEYSQVVGWVAILPAPSQCPGDVNADGETNIADFAIMAANFADSGVTRAQGDLSGDGKVTVADLNLLARDFGCSD